MTRDFRYDTESEPNMRTSSPVSELVERLCDEDYRHEMQHLRSAGEIDLLFQKSASTLTTLSTRNVELEREVKRLREALSGCCDGETLRSLSTSPQGGEHE